MDEIKIYEKTQWRTCIDLLKDLIGQDDFEKSKNNFKQIFEEFRDNNALPLLEQTLTTCSAHHDKNPKDNLGAYVNTSLRNALISLVGEKKDIVKSEKVSVNTNIALLNPGWATNKRLIGKEKIISIPLQDGTKMSFICRNRTSGSLPRDTAMRLYHEIERVYLKDKCPVHRLVRISEADIMRALGKSINSTRDRNALELDIKDLRYTEILSDKVWRYRPDDQGGAGFIPGETSFNMINSFEVIDTRGKKLPADFKERKGKAIYHQFELNIYMAENCRNRHYFLIENDLMFILETPVLFNLVLHLEARRGKDNNASEKRTFFFEPDFNIMCNNIGIVTEEIRERRRSIKEACEYLITKGYLAKYEFEGEGFKVWFKTKHKQIS